MEQPRLPQRLTSMKIVLRCHGYSAGKTSDVTAMVIFRQGLPVIL